jgi:anti-sigma B factor antagonist
VPHERLDLGVNMSLTVPSSSHLVPDPAIHLDAWQRNRVLHLSVLGELDSSSTPALSGELATTQLEAWRAVLFDTSSLSFMDSAGLSVFVDADARVEAAGGLMAIARCPDPIRTLFSTLGHERLLGRERIAIAVAYSEDGDERTWVPCSPAAGIAWSE